jgi:hypothetical protein
VATRPYTAEQVGDRLKARVLGPEGQGAKAFLFPEIEIETSRADYLSLELWRSRGDLIQGYEVKTDRGDWLSELQRPQKADPIVAKCDHFWLVTCEGVLQPNELPENWGLLMMKGLRRHLVVEKPAPKLQRDPLDYQLLKSLLRRIQREGFDACAAIREDAREEARRRSKLDFEGLQRQIDRLEKDLTRHHEALSSFEEAAGIKLVPHFYEKKPDRAKLVGEVVRAIEQGEETLTHLADNLRRIESSAADLVGRVNDTVGELDARIYGKGQAA